MQQYTVALYIDYIIVISQSFEECLLSVVETIILFQKPGNVIHPAKSKFIPAKIVEWFSIIIDSKKKKKNLSAGSEKTKKLREMLHHSNETKLKIIEFN